MGISEDPDHPDSVILYGVGERGYILQASNENYNWKLIRQEKWTREHKETEEQFFARSYSSGTTLYNFGATLANYFDYDFGTSVVLPALDIVPEQTSYEFTQIGNKTIQVTVRFLRNYADEPVVRLVDISAPEVWAIRVRTPAGERIYSPSASSQFVSNSENREKARQVYRAQQDLQAVEVSKTHPYTRMIDLDSLFAFSQVGVYKVQLLYENNDIAERDRDEWIGLFSSQPFTVTITPQG